MRQLIAGIDYGSPSPTIVIIERGEAPDPMGMLTRPQDWAPEARRILWPER